MAQEHENRIDISGIADDKQLASSRRNLIVVALVLLTMNTAQAQLSKVNGLIFELTFENPERLVILLGIATTFLMLRYYNHAAKYHELIYKRWSDRLMGDYFILHYCNEADEFGGIAYEIAPQNIDWEVNRYDDGSSIDTFFRVRLFVNAKFIYERSHQGQDLPDLEQSIIGLLSRRKVDYLKVLKTIIKYWLAEQVKSPESLYLYTPYFIGLAALGSFIFAVPTLA